MGIVVIMSIDYFVVELSENLAANENAVKSVASSFKLDERRARILLSKAPGPVTKPVVRGEAELIAKQFRDAGAKVLVRKAEIDNSERAELSTTKAKVVAKELASNKNIATSVSVNSRNLLKETGEWLETSKQEETREAYSRRLFFSSLLSVIGFAGLALFLFFVNLHQSGFSLGNVESWKQQALLLIASFSAILIGLPFLIYYLKKYLESLKDY